MALIVAKRTGRFNGRIDGRSDRLAVQFQTLNIPACLDFVHVNGMSGEFCMSEILAPGVALFDYDNDRDLDIYLVQSQMPAAGPSTVGKGYPGRRARSRSRVGYSEVAWRFTPTGRAH